MHYQSAIIIIYCSNIVHIYYICENKDHGEVV